MSRGRRTSRSKASSSPEERVLQAFKDSGRTISADSTTWCARQMIREFAAEAGVKPEDVSELRLRNLIDKAVTGREIGRTVNVRQPMGCKVFGPALAT